MKGYRNRHKIGDHLVIDDESGHTIYASDARVCWDGTIRHKSQYEARHPQEFVRAKNDPYPVDPLRPDTSGHVSVPFDLTVGNTSVGVLVGPATHLFRVVKNDQIILGIGDMIVGDTGPVGFRIG